MTDVTQDRGQAGAERSCRRPMSSCCANLPSVPRPEG
jgi:hypothetical protein